MAKLMLVMSCEEVHETIPYAVVCEARYGSRWSTMRRKRRWMAEFTEAEREKAGELFRRAHNWCLGRGIPETVRMSLNTFDLWQRLGAFCGSL